MAENSKIEWTDHTFNPWEGCQKIGPGCDHCYAEARNARFGGGTAVNWGPGVLRRRTSPANWKKPLQWNATKFWQCVCGWRGSNAKPWKGTGICCPLCEGRLYPARARVFCASLADVFDNEVPDEWRADLFDLIDATPNLDWLLLTKRIGNVAPMMKAARRLRHGIDSQGVEVHARPNIWIGATIVNQAEADRDIPKLLQTPAAVRFLSVEPLLGPIDVKHITPHNRCADIMLPLAGLTWTMTATGTRLTSTHPKLDWVIVGGESGRGARPMHPQWARDIRDQCQEAGTPFLFKQWGEWKPICQGDNDWYNSLYVPRVKSREGEDQDALNDSYGQRCTVPQLILRIAGDHAELTQPLAFESGSHAVQAFKVGKKAAGRLLDGVQHDGYPEAR